MFRNAPKSPLFLPVAAALAALLWAGPPAARADLLYVSDFGNDRVLQIDPTTGATLNSYDAPSFRGPQGLAVSADGRTLYAAVASSFGTGPFDVLVYDTLSGERTGTLNATFDSDDLTGLALSADGSTLYAADRGGFSGAADDVIAFDLATGNARPVLFDLDRPNGLALGPGGDSLFVANESSNNVERRNLATGATERTYSTFLDSPSGVAVSPDGADLFVANITPVNGSNRVVKFDAATGNFEDLLFAPGPAGNLVGLAVSPDGDTLLAADAFNDRLLSFDLTTGRASVFGTQAALDSPTYLLFAPAPAGVPEPGVLALLALAAGLAGVRRRLTGAAA